MTPNVRTAIPFLAFLCAPAWGQAPNLTAPQPLPGTAVFGPAAGVQKTPAISRGDASSLLVFEDTRAGESDLFAVRVDAAGTPIDAVPFPITKDPANQRRPRISWNGQSWLVLYENEVNPGSGYFAPQVAAKRVAPNAQVLDAAPLVIDIDSNGGEYAVTSDGAGWIVFYDGYSAGNASLRAKKVAADGAVDANAVVVRPETYYLVYGLSATFAANEVLFTWNDSGMRGRRFTPQLQPIDAAPVALPTEFGPIAASGAEFLVAAMKQTPQFTIDVVATRLNAGLQVAGSTVVAAGVLSDPFSEPRVVWDGTQWIVSWLMNGTQTARAARMTSGGVVLDPGGVALPDSSPNYLYDPALGALPAGGALLAWDDARYGPLELFGATLAANGSAGVERNYGPAAEAQRTPRVAPGPDQALLTFRAELGGASRILAHRLDLFGETIDAEPIVVATAGHANLFTGGAAWNGSHYLIAWSDSTQGTVFARRMLADGTFVDAAPIAVMLGGSADVAALGSDFLVTGLRAPFNPQYVNAYASRVRGADGVVLDGAPLLVGPSFATRARVVALGSRWLVVTERHWSHDENPADVVYRFVDAAGVVSAEFSAGNFYVQNWGIVDVASSGASALVVAQTGSNWTNTEIYARRILPDGSMPAPRFLVAGSAPMGQSRPTVAWTGADYLVAYESLENNVWFYDLEPDVYGVRVSEAGAVLDTVGFPLWNDEDHEVSVAARGLGDGKALLAVSEVVDAGFASFRVSTRALRPTGLANFGSGTPGCDGVQHLDANVAPRVGESSFELRCDRAPANQIGLALVADAKDVGSDPLQLGLVLHVDLFTASLVTPLTLVSDATGHATTAAPIPMDVTAVGAHLYGQAIWLWASGPCVPSPFNLSSSNGLEIVLQAP